MGIGCEGTGIHRIHKQIDDPAIVGTKRKEGVKVHTIAAWWRPRGTMLCESDGGVREGKETSGRHPCDKSLRVVLHRAI